MERKEYKAAARLRVPVVSNGIEYKRISAIIEVYPDEIYIQRGIPPHIMLELEDKNTNSRTIAQPYNVQPKDAEMFAAQMELYNTAKE